MKTWIVAALALITASAAPATAQTRPAAAAAPVQMWRLDCGEIRVTDLDLFSDTYLYAGREKTLTDSCYLIRHGDRYLLWDTGLTGDLVGHSRRRRRAASGRRYAPASATSCAGSTSARSR